MTDFEPDLVRLARNCWVPPAQARELDGRCRAALASSASHTLVCGTTAALVHGLWLPQDDDTIHLATATPERMSSSMTRTRRPEFRAHRRRLSEADRDLVRGIAVTSLERTWRDLAGERGFSLADMVAAGDRALQLGANTDAMTDVCARSSRSPGAAVAARALALLDVRSRSRPESHLRVAVSAPYLPRFQVNVPVFRRDGGWLAEPDLSLPEARLALEYQGSDHAKLGRMRGDITRFTDVRRDGWLFIAYGPAEVFGRPDLIDADVVDAIAERAPHLLGPLRLQRSRHGRRRAG